MTYVLIVANRLGGGGGAAGTAVAWDPFRRF